MKPLKGLLALLLCLAFSTAAKATDHFVSPTGTSGGDGSLAKPWDLQTALYQPSSVLPGDTIWIEGGTYSGTFASHLAGTSTNPIVVRNYQGQRATLDGSGCGGIILEVSGSYTWYWGLEIIDSADNRASSLAPCPAFGVGVYGPGNKFINNIVHDTGEGFSAYDAAPNTEFFGNLSYYNGFVGTTRNEGHGFYLQNSTGNKLVSDNFVGDNALEGIQIYGSGSASLIDVQSVGNILYNTSSWPTPNYQYNFIIGGGLTRSGIVLTNNYSYFPPSSPNGFVDLSDYTLGEDVTATGNVFVGGYSPLSFTGAAGPIVFTGNTVVAGTGALRAVTLGLDSGQSLSAYNWNQNTYYDLSGYHFWEGVNGSGVNMLFSTWQARTSLDSQSTSTNALPTGAWVYVRPNKYEANRGNIAIYNWGQAASVAVNLSSVLSAGMQYEILDAQNYYGAPVVSGTYSGGDVNIPMTGLTKAAPIGFAAPAHTAPLFGTFIILPLGATSTTAPQQADTTPPSVSIASPTGGSAVSGTVTLSASASDNAGVAGVQFAIDGTALGSQITSAPYSTSWNSASVSNGTHTVTATAYDTAGNNSSSSVTVNVNNATSSGASGASSSSSTSTTPAASGTVAFLSTDASTQGSWEGVYGNGGYSIPNSNQLLPAWATFTVQNGSLYTWNPSTTDPRAPETGSGSARMATTWFNTTTFSFDVNFTDGNSHQLALYALDWDSKGRAETIRILDVNTSAVLDSRTVANFTNGVYLVWNISGHVKITITANAGPNAVISGVFFGSTTGTANPGNTATFVRTDTTTQGTWKNVYGLGGYSVADATPSSIPGYAQFTPQNEALWMWASSGTETRDPELPGSTAGTSRQASCWFSGYGNSFDFDVNLTDGQVHPFELYLLDWDSQGRAETIQIVDAVSNTVLDTRTVTNFTQGIYYIWNLSGHVKINITRTAGPNSVVSAVFFD